MTAGSSKLNLPNSTFHVNTIDLKRLHELDPALAAMHFAFRGLIREADKYLEKIDLTRVHHRILFAIRRRDELSVTGLCELLGVSKQALHRPMKVLLERKLVVLERHPLRPKFKMLALTPKGIDIETAASDRERAAMKSALERVSAKERLAWFEVMSDLASRA
jgi:DNA-binding MarR family transcriptional regulator